ncbi:MAG: hypothetical protein KC449_22900, partial [Anaerolineales bacterium]|nr:hypothetical protein [Anaerolineales bacterium]
RHTHLDWGFGLKWVVSCALGTAVFGLLAYLSMWTVGEAVGNVSSELLGTMVAGLLFGAFFALGGTLGPGWLLQSKGISAKRWIGHSVAVTAVVMSGGVALMSTLFELVPEPVSALYIGLVLGLPMGLVQWRLLTQKNIPATLWPLISVVGYLFAAAIIVYLSGDGREWLIILMGLLVGAVTGLGMMWLLRRETAVAA